MTFSTAKGLSEWAYSSSIAATWVWAPALFVASQMAYEHGLTGFLMFLIPNALTLIVFGWIASKAVKTTTGATAPDFVSKAGKNQVLLHKGITLVLLASSTIVQLLGVYVLAHQWFGLNRFYSGVGVLSLALLIVWKGGLRTCILSDRLKFLLILSAGLILSMASVWQGNNIHIDSKGTSQLFWSFGVPTFVGLLAAPYVDTTFWQRAASISHDRIQMVFTKAAFLFAVVPCLFALIGFSQPLGIPGWSLAKAFSSFWPNALLGVAVFAALISTIDSNLCAVGALSPAKKERLCIVVFSLLVLAIFALQPSLTIVDLFLLYGTMRSIAAIPTILVVFDRFNAKRLTESTLIALTICPFGFILCQPLGLGWVFTALAVSLPLFGYSWKRSFNAIPRSQNVGNY